MALWPKHDTWLWKWPPGSAGRAFVRYMPKLDTPKHPVYARHHETNFPIIILRPSVKKGKDTNITSQKMTVKEMDIANVTGASKNNEFIKENS